MARPKGTKDSKVRKKRIPYKSLKLIGTKINRWTILELDNSDGHEIKFLVLCECGTKGWRNYSTIASGKSQSCGCYHSELMSKRQFKGKDVSAFNKLIRTYEHNAKRRKLDYNLSEKQFKILVSGNCYYCNKEPYMKMTTFSGTIIYNGIDRVNNNFGYLEENCVSCCKPCNLAKHSITKDMIFKLYHRLFKNE